MKILFFLSFGSAALTGALTPILSQAAFSDSSEDAVWWLMGIFSVLFCSTFIGIGSWVATNLARVAQKLNEVSEDFHVCQVRQCSIIERIEHLEELVKD